MKKGRFPKGAPHSWLGLGRNGHHHGVARGQVSRTDSEHKRKNGRNRYVLFLEHRYAVTHSLVPLVRLSRAVTGFKNHPPSSRSMHTLMRGANKRPNGRTEKTITNEALKIAPHLQCTFPNPSSRRHDAIVCSHSSREPQVVACARCDALRLEARATSRGHLVLVVSGFVAPTTRGVAQSREVAEIALGA